MYIIIIVIIIWKAATSSRRLSFSATADLFREKTNNKIALKDNLLDDVAASK